MLVLFYMLMEDILKSKANFLSPCISGDSSTQPQPWILVWLRVSGILAANTPPWGLGDAALSSPGIWCRQWEVEFPSECCFSEETPFFFPEAQYWAHPWFSKVSAGGPTSSSSLCSGSFHYDDMSFCNSGMFPRFLFLFSFYVSFTLIPFFSFSNIFN